MHPCVQDWDKWAWPVPGPTLNQARSSVNHFKNLYNLQHFQSNKQCTECQDVYILNLFLKCHFYLENLNFKWLIIPCIFAVILRVDVPGLQLFGGRRKCSQAECLISGPISTDKLTYNFWTLESVHKITIRHLREILAWVGWSVVER